VIKERRQEHCGSEKNWICKWWTVKCYNFFPFSFLQ